MWDMESSEAAGYRVDDAVQDQQHNKKSPGVQRESEKRILNLMRTPHPVIVV